MPQISLQERKDVVIPSYSYFGDSESSKKNKKTNNQKQTSMSDFMDN
jgi:hypothetical protein